MSQFIYATVEAVNTAQGDCRRYCYWHFCLRTLFEGILESLSQLQGQIPVIQSSSANLHSHQQCERIPLQPHCPMSSAARLLKASFIRWLESHCDFSLIERLDLFLYIYLVLELYDTLGFAILKCTSLIFPSNFLSPVHGFIPAPTSSRHSLGTHRLLCTQLYHSLAYTQRTLHSTTETLAQLFSLLLCS